MFCIASLRRSVSASSLNGAALAATHRVRSPEELYSRRALRRARLIIELRLLQFRKERLECVRGAILRNLPPDLRPRNVATKGTRPLDPETCDNLFLYRGNDGLD